MRSFILFNCKVECGTNFLDRSRGRPEGRTRTSPAHERKFFQRAGLSRHMKGDFSNGPGRHVIGDFWIGPGQAGKKRNEFFNGRVWLRKKENEKYCESVRADKTKTKF